MSQKIMNGMLYDTEDAECICQFTEYGDCSSNCTALWKTKKGNYFFEGTFGLDESTKEEAKKFFLENIDGVHNTYEEYVEEFGDDIPKA